MPDATILGLERMFQRRIHRLPGNRVAIAPDDWAHLCRLLARQGVVPNSDWGYNELIHCLRAVDRRQAQP